MGNEHSGGAEHWAASAEAARRRKREPGGRKNGSELNRSARAALALQGRKLFSDFHDAQADFAKKWGEERGNGLSGLLGKESPALGEKYEVLEAMACGVTAVVCKGVNKSTREVVAIKFVRIRVQGLSEAIRRKDCQEEARLQRICEHKNVVKLIDFEMGKTFALYVLEFVDKTLLQKIVERNDQVQYSERVAAGYIRDLARALKHCHSIGVVHMDVKLDNVLCTADNVAKLCDFGVAEQMRFSNTPIKRTVAAPLFAPPEIYLRGHCTTKADMWSLGVILYILLCGYPPFKETELRERIMNARYTFPERDWVNVSIMARDLISRLLVLDTTVRYSAEQVLEHPWIRAVGNESPSLTKTILQVPTEPPPPPSSKAEMEGQNSSVSAIAALSNSVAASAPLTPNPTLSDEELRALPLPLRVTRFLRNMHHYRELEKKGFENVPGGSLYRNILDGVDELTVGLSRREGEGSASPIPNWLSRAVRKNLSLSSGGEDSESEDGSNLSTLEPLEHDPSKSSEKKNLASRRPSSKLEAGISDTVAQQLTGKDIYTQARLRTRTPSIISQEVAIATIAAMSGSASTATPPAPSQDKEEKDPPSKPRMKRAKSFDIRPESAPDWIKDNEAVSCRICDKEFSVFIRKHHCRSCGGIFCDACCRKRLTLKLLDNDHPVRVCRLCASHYTPPVPDHHQTLIDRNDSRELSASQIALHRYQSQRRSKVES